MDDIKIEFTIEDASPQVKAQMQTAIKRALYAAGVTIQRGATESISGLHTAENRAVDTGRLRASISFITPEQRSQQVTAKPENAKENDTLSGSAPDKTLIFGTNVEYATYVHEGARGVAGRPFLREGVDVVKDDLKDTLERIFKGEL